MTKAHDHGGAGRAMASTVFRSVECLAAAGGAGLVFLILPWPNAGFSAAWWLLVIVVVRSDVSLFLIPDWASAGIAALGLVHRAVLGPFSGSSLDATLLDLGAALANGAFAFTLFWTVGRIYRLIAKHEGLGFGAVKLAAASAL